MNGVEVCRISAAAATPRHLELPQKNGRARKRPGQKEGHNLQRGTPLSEMGGKHRTDFSLLNRFSDRYDG
jgi:hypothetical protein